MSHRNTIFVEEAEILAQQPFPAGQHVLRVRAPRCAEQALPGNFAHLRCDPLVPMRRPLSILGTDPGQGHVEFLYKVVGHGTALLARRVPGERVSVLGPIGKPFAAHPRRPRALLVGGGVGIPPMLFLADHLRRRKEKYQPLVLMGSEIPFPFRPAPGRLPVPGMPDGVVAAMPWLEERGVPSRLASGQGFPGCLDGYVTDLARAFLGALTAAERDAVEVFACGPTPMLAAVAAVAREQRLPCQVSLEEFMACALGGCAGCAVEVRTARGPAMKRVCVDGPVFDAATVFPGA